nr:hypothetical protein [Tanacetum cinerariifolium]
MPLGIGMCHSGIDPQNTDNDVTFEVKEPESEIFGYSDSSAKIKKHDDRTKREAKGKSPIELSIGLRNLSEEFEDFSDNNINEVNAASTPVLAVGQISTNSTNTFSVAGPFNTATDFSNLETSIPFSLIPTTRVHKDHHMTKIIGDLTSAPQTRSMTRMVKEQEGASSIQDAKGLGTSGFAKRLYQMDVKSAFLYETIKEEVYVCQPLGFEDPDYHDKVYKVVKTLYGLHQAPRAWYETLANYLLENGFHREKIYLTLFIKKQKGDILLVQKQDGIFISQDKYVAEILRKFGLTDGKSASTPIDTDKPLLKDPDGEDVDVHTYSDYVGTSLDRKSTIGGCQFLRCRLISWQCKKETVVTTSSTRVEYVVAASCCAQVLWIQN